MRCLTLARKLRLRGATVVFLMRTLNGNLIERVRDDGFHVAEIDPSESIATLSEEQDAQLCLEAIQQGSSREERVSWVIVDHYELGEVWESHVRSVTQRLLVIDDLANRVHDADVLLDQNLVAGYLDRYDELVPDHCVKLIGPTYALIASRYAELRSQVTRVTKPKRSLLVYFGGADQEMTSMTVNALTQLPSDFAARIVLDRSNPQCRQVAEVCARDGRFSLSGQLPDLAEAMAGADLFIGASGTTSWERMALGLSAAVVTIAENQEPLAQELQRRGFISWLGRSDVVSIDSLVHDLRAVLAAHTDANAANQMMSLVDALGTERVADIVMYQGNESLELRLALPSDSNVILRWANDPVTRSHAFNPRPIAAQEHAAWYARRLSSTDVVFLLAQSPNGIPVGQVRFERQPDRSWEISYLVAPLFRGRGIARPMLDMAIRKLCDVHARARVSGYVKLTNPASIRVFEGLGFNISAQQDKPDAVRYELSQDG